MGSAITKSAPQGITSYLTTEAVRNNIMSVVGEKQTQTFISSIVSAVQANPALSKCTNASILSAALLGESLKLTPSPQLGFYYLVPYNDTKTGKTEAQFQMGAKGYKQLAIRSGQYRKIVATAVKEGELNYYNPITEDFSFTPITNESKRAKAKTIGYYGMFELVNGFRKEIYWSKEKMEEHAKHYSKGYANDLKKKTSYTFWSKDFDNMAEKTIMRQLISKWGIMSVDMQNAFTSDMAVVREDGTPDYVDNLQADVREVVAEEIAENANTVDFAEVIEKTQSTENYEQADFIEG